MGKQISEIDQIAKIELQKNMFVWRPAIKLLMVKYPKLYDEYIKSCWQDKLLILETKFNYKI